MFRFQQGQIVALMEDRPRLLLHRGDVGTIWALYDTEPPQYEATFVTQDGHEIDLTIEESEIVSASTVPSRPKAAKRGRAKVG